MNLAAIWSIVIFILVLSFLVIIHELGHFIAAKFAKVKVEEFGLGYPPLMKKLFTWRGTAFSLNWIPFGGFVRMEGEEAQVNSGENVEDSFQVGPFYSKSTFWRLVIILAGAAVNFVFGILAFAIVYSFVGIPTPLNQPRIGLVLPNSPAADANIPTQVNIIAIRYGDEVKAVETVSDAATLISSYAGKTIILITTGKCEQEKCQEMAQEFSVYVRTPEEVSAAGQKGAIGIAFQSEYAAYYPWYQMPFKGIWIGIQQAIGLSVLILQALSQMISQLFSSGHVPADLMGPVGIVDNAAKTKVLLQGPLAILQFAGLLSINLAIMNVLPIPALDGGRALFIFLEKIVGKKRIQKVEGLANYGGFIFLMILIVLITGRDIWRVVVGS